MGRNIYENVIEDGDILASDIYAAPPPPAPAPAAPASWKAGYDTLKKQMEALQGQTDIYKRRSPLSADTHIDNIATALARDYGVNTIGDLGVRTVTQRVYEPAIEDVSPAFVRDVDVQEYYNKTTGQVIPGYKFASEGRGDGYSNYSLQSVPDGKGGTIVIPVQQYSKSGMGSFVENLGPILPVANLVAMAAGVPPLWMAAGNVALQYGAGNINDIGDALKVAAPFLVAAGVQELASVGGSGLSGLDVGPTIPVAGSEAGTAFSNLVGNSITGTAADIAGGALSGAARAGLADGDIGTSALVGGLSPAISAGVKSAFSGVKDAYKNFAGLDVNVNPDDLSAEELALLTNEDGTLAADLFSVDPNATYTSPVTDPGVIEDITGGFSPEAGGVFSPTEVPSNATLDTGVIRPSYDESLGHDWAEDLSVDDANDEAMEAMEAIKAANADDAARAANANDEAIRAIKAANADDDNVAAIEAINAEDANVAAIEAANAAAPTKDAAPPTKDATGANKLTPDNYTTLLTALIAGTITAETFKKVVSGEKAYDPADLTTKAAPALATMDAKGLQSIDIPENRYWQQTGVAGTAGQGGVQFFDWSTDPTPKTGGSNLAAAEALSSVPAITTAPAATTAKQYFNQSTNRYYTDPTGTWQAPAGWNEVSKPLSGGGKVETKNFDGGGLADYFDYASGWVDPGLDLSSLGNDFALYPDIFNDTAFNLFDSADVLSDSQVNDYLRNLPSDNASYGDIDRTAQYQSDIKTATAGEAKSVIDKLTGMGAKLTESALKSIAENPGKWLAALAGAGLGYAASKNNTVPSRGLKSLGLSQQDVYGTLKGVPIKRAMGGELGGYAGGGGLHYLKSAEDGMADRIPATIDNKQPARLSGGEFVIPADVVSHLGNGNSEAGAKQLYGMMDRIRHARTGTKKQGKKINPAKFTPK
jgi:hypothetical protein